MTLVAYDEPEAFIKSSQEDLERRESENNLMLGIVDMAAKSPDLYPGSVFIRAEDEAGEFLGAAICTPPFEAVLTELPEAVISPLMKMLVEKIPELRGVTGPLPCSERAAACGADLFGARTERGMGLQNYVMERVEPPPEVPGGMRVCRGEERDLVMEWTEIFCEDHTEEIAWGLRRAAEDALKKGRVFFWEDGGPVSMAAYFGETRHGGRISLVFTPEELRRCGYGSACVAALSQHILDSGKRFCFLNADLANPVSNSIYSRIGYRPVTKIQQFRFVRESATG